MVALAAALTVSVAAVVAAQDGASTTEIRYAVPRLAVGALTLAAARFWALGRPTSRSPLGGLLAGLATGWPVYAVAALALWSGRPEASSFRGPEALALFTLSMLSVGLFEETLTRGLALGVLLRTFPGNRRGRLAAVVVSSVLFGLAHLVNVTRQTWSASWIQVAYGPLVGVFLAAVRLRGDSLAAVVLLHALLDWSFYLSSDVFTGRAASTNGASGGAGLTVVAIGILLAGYGCWVLSTVRATEPASVTRVRGGGGDSGPEVSR